MAKNVTTARMDPEIAEMVKVAQGNVTKAIAEAAQSGWGRKTFGRYVDEAQKKLALYNKALVDGNHYIADKLKKDLDKVHLDILKPKDIKEGVKDLTKGLAGATESFGDGLHKAFGSLKGKDLGGLLGQVKGLGKSVSIAGSKMEETTQKGKMGDVVAGLGKAVSGLGAVVMAIAGIGLAFAALVKIVMDADSRIKDLNKSMIAAGIAGQEFGNDVGQGMERIRDAFTGTGAIKYLDELGIKSEEAIAAMGGFQKAGLTFQEMGGGANSSAEAVDRLRESVKGAVVYAKLLGESADKVAGDMAKMAEETATTLEGVRDKFSEIAAAAKQSGFDTKRFYGMVLEVTTGMSMYNVRLQDTIGLLTQAGKVLGPDAGKAWAQSLAGGMKDMSTRDLAVNAMKMGKGQVQGAAKEDAKAQAGALSKSFKDIAAKPGKAADQLNAALGKAGLSAGLSPEDLAKGLGSMSKDQADILRAELNRVEGVSGLGTKTAHAQMVARAGEGKGGLGGQVNAMQQFGAVGTLMTKVRGAHAVSARTDFDKLDTEDVVGKIAAESLKTGAGAITSQDADMLRDAIGALRSKGDKVTMEGIAKELGLAQETADKTAKEAEEAEKKRKDAYVRDQELAGQIVTNTQSIADRMDNVIEQLLTEIAGGINKLVSFFWGGQGILDKEARRGAIEATQGDIAKLTEQLGKAKPEERAEIREKISKKRAMLDVVTRDTETTGGSKDFLMAAALKTLSPEDKAAMEKEKAAAGASHVQRVKEAYENEDKSGVSASSEQLKKDNAAIEQKYFEKQTRIDDKRSAKNTKELLDGQAKLTKEEREIGAISAELIAAGVTDKVAANAIAQKMQSGAFDVGAGKWGPQASKVMQSRRAIDAYGAQGPVARDGILTLDRGDGNPRMHRIDSSDDVIGIGKPGGPLSKGGGNISISVNQWGDVPGAVLKALETMRVRT